MGTSLGSPESGEEDFEPAADANSVPGSQQPGPFVVTLTWLRIRHMTAALACTRITDPLESTQSTDIMPRNNKAGGA